MINAARRRGISHVRHPIELDVGFRHGRAFAAMSLLRTVLPRQALLDDVRFTGFGAMNSGNVEGDLLSIVSELSPGTTELMVHPGYESPDLAALDPYRAPRERELRALTSQALRQRIHERGVQLTHFGTAATAGSASTATR